MELERVLVVRLNNSVCVHRFRVQRSGFPDEIGIQGYLSVCESDADEPFVDLAYMPAST